jgi:glutathione peroxidase
MTDLTTIALKRNDGSPVSLADYRGQVLLIVNVASKCGLTPQYEALEALYRDRKADGLTILGFPANNFRGQEPGTDAEIASFCTSTYDVTFPLFSKISVTGEDTHPLYQALTQAVPEAIGEGTMRARLAGYGIETGSPGEVLWNFEKFLVGRDGNVIARFAPDVAPNDPRITGAIDTALTT